MKKKLLLIGGGGHCKSCVDVIEAEGKYMIKGIIENEGKIGTHLLQYPVIAKDESIETFISEGYFFLITIGQIKSSKRRKELYQMLEGKSANIATIISPSALVSKYASIGQGTIIMHGALVNAGAIVGNNVIINTNSLIEHDAIVGDHVHISTHAIVNGSAKVEEDSFIGSNAVVVQDVFVGKSVIVGAGSVIISDIKDPGIYAGNPAKKIKDE